MPTRIGSDHYRIIEVFWNDNYVNDDGTKGAYMMYYCTSSTYKRSAIGYAVSQNIEGPYTYVDTIMYSGFTKNDAYDSNSTKNTKYVNIYIVFVIIYSKESYPIFIFFYFII